MRRDRSRVSSRHLGGGQQGQPEGPLRDAAAFPELNRLAAAKRVTAEALVLKYMRLKWPCIIQIPSARSMEHLEDAVCSSAIKITAQEMARLDTEGDQSCASHQPWEPQLQ